jgi:subtilisin family serine protease
MSEGRLTWDLLDREPPDVATPAAANVAVTRDWAWGGSTGAGAKVCVVDSGIEADHPLVGEVHGFYEVVDGADGVPHVQAAEPGDRFGHGTACAGIIRSVAPDCELYSVRVLGDRYRSAGDALAAGLRWAVAGGFDVINLSLSTSRRQFSAALHQIADDAYFNGVLIAASAHNSQIESFPWRFASVISVGSHGERDSDVFFYNPAPPVEFFARGLEVEVAWLQNASMVSTGNSFATPHMAGYCALIRAQHPELRPFQVKNVLFHTANNVRGES